MITARQVWQTPQRQSHYSMLNSMATDADDMLAGPSKEISTCLFDSSIWKQSRGKRPE